MTCNLLIVRAAGWPLCLGQPETKPNCWLLLCSRAHANSQGSVGWCLLLEAAIWTVLKNCSSAVQWADQGVLLLNVCLTVRAHEANSHSKKGWEQFTDAVVAALNRKRKDLVFLLWGRNAEIKGKSIDRQRHHVLTAAHPSGLSANRVGSPC